MTIRGMEVFLAVVETMNMSKAAEKLHIAQPTISQTIKEIEQEYAVLLFNRIGKKLFLTKEGEELARHARGIMLQVTEMQEAMTYSSNHPELHIGATITIGQSLLAPAVGEFERSFPQAGCRVMVGNTSEIEKLLLEGKLDAAFVEGVVKSSELIAEPVCRDEMVLVCHPEHPLAAKREVKLKEVVAYPFLVREQGSGTRELLQSRLDEQGLKLNIKWEAHSFDSLLSGVRVNQGISVFSRRAAERQASTGEIVMRSIKDVELVRDFCFVIHKNKRRTKLLEGLVACFENQAKG